MKRFIAVLFTFIFLCFSFVACDMSVMGTDDGSKDDGPTNNHQKGGSTNSIQEGGDGYDRLLVQPETVENDSGVSPENKGATGVSATTGCLVSWNQGSSSQRTIGTSHTISLSLSEECDVDDYKWNFQDANGYTDDWNGCSGSSCNDDPGNSQFGGYKVYVEVYDNGEYVTESGIHRVEVTKTFVVPLYGTFPNQSRVDSHSTERTQYCKEKHFAPGDYNSYTEESRGKWDERADYINGSWLIWSDYHSGKYIKNIQCTSKAP